MDGPRLLAAYLTKKKISLRELARRATASPASICRARQGKGLGLAVALRIQDATDGAIPVEAWRAA